jgi:cytochrome c peroxidase
MLLALAAVIAIPLGLDAYLPVPEDNPLTPAAIELGRQLFHDKRLSRDGSVSCATCHDPERAFSDGNAVAVGVGGKKGTRNAPALINRAWGTSFFWDGRTSTLEEQVLLPITNPVEMDMTLEAAEARVGVPTRDISRALATFVRSLLSGESPYDRYVHGERTAMGADAVRGLMLFRGKANCIACHVPPTFTDERFHNTGVAWRNGRFEDEGRFNVTRREPDKGAFRTPTLREISRTGPYMHDGSVATLDDVVEYYDRGGNPNPTLDSEIRALRLTASEKQDLIAFLRSLNARITGE